MAPSGHRKNLQPKSSAEIFSRNLHPCRSTGDSLYKFGRTKHCSVRYKRSKHWPYVLQYEQKNRFT